MALACATLPVLIAIGLLASQTAGSTGAGGLMTSVPLETVRATVNHRAIPGQNAAFITVPREISGLHALGSNPVRSSMPATAKPRQMWVWHFDDPSALVDLGKRNAISDLLVWVSPGVTDHSDALARLRRLRTAATAAGLQLDALGGDPSWAIQPQRALAWAKEVHQSGLFDRLHLDIEPHGLANWSTQRSELVTGLLSAVQAAGSVQMPVDVDIPYWYYTIGSPDGVTLDQAVMKLSSTVTIMAYRNNASSVLTVADTEMMHAAALRKMAWIGVNTASSGEDPATTTFLGQSAPTIDRALATLDARGAQWPSFAGLALHDSESLASLQHK